MKKKRKVGDFGGAAIDRIITPSARVEGVSAELSALGQNES